MALLGIHYSQGYFDVGATGGVGVRGGGDKEEGPGWHVRAGEKILHTQKKY